MYCINLYKLHIYRKITKKLFFIKIQNIILGHRFKRGFARISFRIQSRDQTYLYGRNFAGPRIGCRMDLKKDQKIEVKGRGCETKS